MTRRWIVVTAMAAVAFFAASLGLSWFLARPPHQPIEPKGPVVMIAMPTLTWQDVSAESTPNLWKLSQRGAVGNVVTRTVTGHSCSRNAWLTLSAGTRTAVGPLVPETPSGESVECPPVRAPVEYDKNKAWFSDWAGWAEDTGDRGFKARIGMLAESQQKAGRCVAAVGPLAAYGAANRDGEVSPFYPDVKQADFGACPVTLVDLQTTQDAALGTVLDRLPKNATVVVSGHADDDTTPERARGVVIAGPDVDQGLLRSSKTRQPGLLQGTDLTTLLMHGSKGPEDGATYESRQPVVQPEKDMATAVSHVRGVDVALRDEHRLVAPFFYTYVVLVLMLTALGGLLWRRSRPAGRRVFAALGAWSGSVPISTFLIGLLPWWRAGNPGLALTGGILTLAAGLAAVALLGPWRRWAAGPAVIIAVITAVTIALDVTHSSRLQLISLMGLQPVYGGRYFGMGNVAYAMYASCALLATALLAGRWIQRRRPRLAAATVVVMGACTIIIDGHPSWGADAGGPLALFPAFAYLALNAGGIKVTWQRIVAVGGVALVIVGGLGYLDYLRPKEYRTHIGDFVAGFLEDGSTSALQRNIELNFEMLISQWVNLFVPVLLALAMYALMRPTSRLGRPLRVLTQRVRFLGHGLAAITICWLIGFCTNDSGTAIPPAGMVVIIPLVILIAASRGRLTPRDVAQPRRDRARPATPVRSG